MKAQVLAGFCPDTLCPLNKREIYRRAARREQIRAEQARVAKSNEAHLPADERRQIIDLAELWSATKECAIAMACAAPVSLVYVVYLVLN